MMNLVLLLGRLSRPGEVRLLPSGDRLLQLELTVPREGERAETVPVVWYDPPARVAALDVDDLVVVMGRVRRRYFRARGSTQSRTEVVADQVVPARQARRVSTLLEKARATLDGPSPDG